MNDWRLTNQFNYLFKKQLVKCKFEQDGNQDHEHCSFCWEKFGNNMLQEGYCTEDRYYWVCSQCYDDFKEMFEWTIDHK